MGGFDRRTRVLVEPGQTRGQAAPSRHTLKANLRDGDGRGRFRSAGGATGIELRPEWAALLMSASSIIVATNAVLLKRVERELP